MKKTYKNIGLDEKTFEAVAYTAKGLGMSKTAFLKRIMENIIQETALLKIGSMRLETSHGYGLIKLRFSGIPYTTMGTINVPINISDKQLDKAIFDKVYGETNL